MGQKTKFNFFIMFGQEFKKMTLGKTLWTIAVIKLLIMFLILKPIFFPNFLSTKFNNATDKGNYVGDRLCDKVEDDDKKGLENIFNQ